MEPPSSPEGPQDTLPQGKRLRSRSTRISRLQLTTLDTGGAEMAQSPTGDQKKSESDSALVQNLQRQVAKLRNDLKTSNTQLSLVRQQKTKANDEVCSRRLYFLISTPLLVSYDQSETHHRISRYVLCLFGNFIWLIQMLAQNHRSETREDNQNPPERGRRAEEECRSKPTASQEDSRLERRARQAMYCSC